MAAITDQCMESTFQYCNTDFFSFKSL